MLKTIINFLRKQLTGIKFSWSLVGLLLWVAVLIAVWWWGPLLNVSGVHPFSTLWGRVGFTLAWLWLMVGVCTWVIWQKIRRLKAERLAMRAKEQDPISLCVEGQQYFLDSWLQALRTNKGSGALWTLPWYLMLGMPGSGKSSLMHRANTANKLNTRLSAELRKAAKDQKVDCWLGEEAVIFDPKGELLLPAVSDEQVEGIQNEHLWQHLLTWLNTNRQRQPLNGVVMTLDLAWLSFASVSERKTCAQLLRRRLQDVSVTLNTRLPVYFVLTRLDVLNGFHAFFQQLDKESRQSLLGVTFNPQSHHLSSWMAEFDAFWEEWLAALNANLPDKMLSSYGEQNAAGIFSFVRQLAGLKYYLDEVFAEMMADEERLLFRVRGIYLSSVCQQGVPLDAFTNAASRRYQLPDLIYPSVRGTSQAFFVRDLFRQTIFPEAHLAGESRLHLKWRRRHLAVGIGMMVIVSLALLAGWQHYYRINENAGKNVLTQAQQFIAARDVQDNRAFGVNLLPRLNLIREATLSYGDYRQKDGKFADMGLYQGDKIGPFVEASYLKLLETRFLPAVMAGLTEDLHCAPASSEAKFAVLRVMRMIEDDSGRNKPLVRQFMAQRWQKAFPNQGRVQEQLKQHLEYALEHTDWKKARASNNAEAIAVWQPFDQPVKSAQHELSKLPLYQRVYQSLFLRAKNELPPDLKIRDEVGLSFDNVFSLRNENTGSVMRFFTWQGFNDYFIRQDARLFDLTALDAWVLGLRSRIHLSDADRNEIQRQVNDRYITDYVNSWQKVLSNLDVQELSSPEQALALLDEITGSEQPFRRVLVSLSDNTRIRTLNEDVGTMTRDTNKRIGRPFVPLDDALHGSGDNQALVQEINQKLTNLSHWLEQIVNAKDPGIAALKAIQQREANPYNDPAFILQQYARSLPAPLDRWINQITQQVSGLMVSVAMSSLNDEWQNQVVGPFTERFADRYPFNPASDRDVALSDMERFFSAGGTLDGFYQANLKPLMEAGLLKNESHSVLQELQRQLEHAQLIRNTLFNAQGSVEVHLVVEPVELTANKRRSVLNIDGQLLEYAHGRRQKIPLVWPNSLRDGSESKLTLVPDNAERSPRSVQYTGPWAMFRLVDSSVRTQNNRGSFDIRFNVDNGSMTYRIYTDESHNPFASGLFSQFRLPESLY